jgi:flagellar biosynthesis protein FlhB
MPDESFQEKTEPASPRRRSDARKKGNIPRSQEVNSVFVLVVGIAVLKIFGGVLFRQLSEQMRWVFGHLSDISVTAENMPALALSGIKFVGLLLFPILGVVAVAGVGASVIQGGMIFSADPLTPKFERCDPIKGIKRLFSYRSLIELVKSLLKLAVVGWVGYSVIAGEFKAFPFLADRAPGEILAFTGQVCFKLVLKTSLALLVIAGFDYAYQRYQFEHNLRMTKQDIREEYKSTEGDPIIKSRIRSVQRERARQRMMKDVPKADVVVTNPTHLAVALRYDVEKHGAPVVVAKGERLIAERIKEIAKAHGVPIIENKPLARMLFRNTDVGSEIPFELYKAVAEILAVVYRMRNRAA